MKEPLETTSSARKNLKICLINPRFEPSFWSYDYAMPLYPNDIKCQMLTAALPALAGLLDRRHDIRLIDENVEPIDFSALNDFDIIGVTGMIVQKWRMQEILQQLRSLKATLVVGGPLVTCDPEFFSDLCDVRFLGEAESTWPQFIEDIAAGNETLSLYRQEQRSDMSEVPKPRLELSKTQHYEVACVQFSRGCPYRCEFCDIIIMFGRVPRTKRPAQVLAEFDDVKKAGFKTCFLVDDNFIGNKKEAKALLREIIGWQQRHDYPLVLSTEASINLADEPELLKLMVDANFTHVFVGIESPNPAALKETLKTQNLLGNDSLEDKIKRIRAAGLIVIGGFIVGFDEDTETVFEDQYQFIQNSGIGLSSIGILSPLPTTPLYERLEAEKRLYPADPECAFIPKNMSREQLKQGHRELMTRVYAPQAFFSRIFETYRESHSFRQNRARINRQRLKYSSLKRSNLKRQWFTLRVAVRLIAALVKARESHLLSQYLQAWRSNRTLPDRGIPAQSFIDLCAKHWHFYRIAHGPQNSVYLETLKPDSAT